MTDDHDMKPTVLQLILLGVLVVGGAVLLKMQHNLANKLTTTPTEVKAEVVALKNQVDALTGYIDTKASDRFTGAQARELIKLNNLIPPKSMQE